MVRDRLGFVLMSASATDVSRGSLGTAFNADEAREVLDAEGLIVTPGFIDNHAHIQSSIRERPLAENFLRQGITTILASLHSGDQPWPLDQFMASLEGGPQCGVLRRPHLGAETGSRT